MSRIPLILLVEDNPDDVALTLRAFEKYHIANQIVVARDGEEALDYLFSANGKRILPQVVLLDLKVPKYDGLEILRRIRADERTKLLPVVILTSSEQDEDLMGSYRAGANSYVRKPVDFVEFTEAARQLGLYWMVLNNAAPTTRAHG
ncbi:MAG TPA: response regulator [Nevskiaceae bacterium]|nr:response regulator [Nevskiaceae bacterium]